MATLELTVTPSGQIAVAVQTPLGALAHTVEPMEVGWKICEAALSLREAADAAEMCENICKDIKLTAIARVPIVCTLLRLGQLFPDGDDAASLNQSMRRCCEFAIEALDEALTAMYEYLASDMLGRWRQAGGLKEQMAEKRLQLRHRFDDVNAYVDLANLLRDQQSSQQAQHTTAMVEQLQRTAEEVESMRTADKARVKALARAVLARRTREGQTILVHPSRAQFPPQTTAAAVSPCGGCFVVALSDGSAAVWDAATGTCMHALTGAGWVSSVAWSPDGSKVATGSQDKTAAVWNAATGACMHAMQGHRGDIRSVAWSPDGSRVATGSADKTAAVWDAATGARMHELVGHTRSVTSVAWSPDGSRVATGSEDKTAAVWDAATGMHVHELRGDGGGTLSVAWSPDGSMVATCAGAKDKTAAVWDAATGDCMHVLRGHTGMVRRLAWSPDGSRVATGSEDGTAAVWDAATGARVHVLRGHSSKVSAVAWSPDGSRVATGSWDFCVAVWDAATGTRMHELCGHGFDVLVAWSPDGRVVYSATEGRTVRIYNIARMTPSIPER